MNREVTARALTGIKLVEPGDDLGAIAVEAFAANGLMPEAGDVLVVAQKIVSKAEGRYVNVANVEPSERAIALAAETDKDPRFVEVVLSESRRVVRHRPGLLIVEHRLGFVMANAGIDHSNIETGAAGERVLLLPLDPDGSAARLRRQIGEAFGARVGVIVSDSFGRPWRKGTVGVALGAAGLPSTVTLRAPPAPSFRRAWTRSPSAGTNPATASGVAAASHLSNSARDAALRASTCRRASASSPSRTPQRARSCGRGTWTTGGVSLMFPSIAAWVVLLKNAAIA